jgi:pectin methylesterase-like acyl-CoA thioesterase
MKRFAALTGFLCLIGLAFTVRATNPAWWTSSATQVIDSNSDHSTSANYAPANLGQLKNVARQAKLHLDTYLPGGAGSQIGNMVSGFSTDPAVNYAPINLGQLKAVARPFYDRLGSAGYDTKANLIAHGYPTNWGFNYPWDPSTPVSANYAPANLGQIKMAFSFDLTGKTATLDSDGDGLPDAWEIANFGSLDPHPTQDDDHDGQTNAQEWAAGTDPNTPQGAEVSGLWMYEYYSNITGVTVADLRNAPIYPGQPTGRTYVGTPDAPHDWADNYGARLTGYIVVPTTGSYQFVVAGDNEAELWLSTTGKPAGLQKVASVPNGNWTNYREWTKYPQQTSASMQLTAGQELFVEVLQKEGTGGDNASVGWIAPGTTTAVPIPSTAMRGVGSLAIDSDNDGLPDFWEIANFGNLDHKPNQDDDRDGKTNAQEYALGTDPNDPLGAKVPGVWLYETYDNISGATLASLRSAAIYPGQPTGRTYVATADAPQNRADNFGSRMSGYIVIPDTGYYQFAVAGDDETELWLSTTGKPGGLQKMAYVPSGRFTGYQEWTKYSQQKSTSMYLTAGQELYVEVLQKEGTGGDNASVGWIVPGDTTVQPLPQEVMEAVGDVSIDADHDGLPDFWEIAYFGNIAPSPGDDPDGDGRSNLQEYQQGSDPNDFYNGVPPSIEVTSGNWQTGKPNAFLPQPLRIRLLDNNGAPYTNSPVTFTISDGDGQLAPTITGSPSLSQAITLRTDANGYAQVYLYQGVSDSSGVDVDAGDQTAAFSASVDTLSVGLMGEWNFEEISGYSTADISGDNQTGTLSGGASFGTSRAEGNRSMTFNGTNGSVTVPDSAALNLSGTTMSLALWVKPDGAGTKQTLLAKSGNQAYRLFLNGNGTIGLSLALPGGTLAQATSSLAVPDGAWTHVVVTLSISGSQATTTFYLNGVSIGSQTLNSISQIQAATGALTFGVLDTTSNSEAFSGSMDDIRIYNRALEPSEVKTIFKAGTPSSTTHGLVGAYYVGKNFETLGTRRIDPWVNFDWGLNAPNSYVPADGFSVRWTGFIKPRYSETYTFQTISDDGVRLWVNGQEIIDNWTEHSATTNSSKTIALQAGQLYDIKIEYFDTTKSPGYALAKLSWSSPSQSLEVVPSSRLYPWTAPDSWKQRIVDANPGDDITSPDQVLPGDDFDHDGLPNFMEYQLGTDPTDPDTDHDGLTDGEEAGADWPFGTGTNPLNRYSNGDGKQDYADYIHVSVGLLQNVWRDANWLYNPNFYDPDNHSLSLHMQDSGHSDQYVFTNLIDASNYRGYGPDHGVGTVRSFFIKRGSSTQLSLKSANPYYDPSLLPIRPRSSIKILQAVRKRRHHLIQIWSWIDWKSHTDTYNLSIWKYGAASRPGIAVTGMQVVTSPQPYPPLGPEWGNNSGGFVYSGGSYDMAASHGSFGGVPRVAPIGSGAYDTGVSSVAGSWTDTSYVASPSSIGSSAPGGGYSPAISPYPGLYVANLQPYFWTFNVSADPDSDHDGLSDAQETEIFHTNPNSSDSDGDGLPDAVEVASGLNPKANDLYDDSDGDGWPNIYEFMHGTAVTVAGQSPDPNHVVANPPPVFTVDPAHGADSSTDTIFTTIQEAVNASEKNTGTASQPIYPNRYAVIKVKAGTYTENVTTGPADILVIGETGPGSEVPTVRARSGDAIQIKGPSIWENFVITHATENIGRGINVNTKGWVRLINCVVRNNHLTDSYGLGAGIYAGSSGGRLDLIHCTVAYNDASGEGNGLYASENVNIINSILWDAGTASQEIGVASGNVSVTASIVKGGQYGGWDEDPLLTVEGWLTAGSPARDHSSVFTVVGRDIHNQSRPAGASVDIGADEWTNSNPGVNNLPDWWENKYFSGASTAPIDTGDDDRTGPDGVNNLQEYKGGTDPTAANATASSDADTDGDGMPDAYETANGLNPNVDDAYEDKDGDGWPNIYEYKHGTRVDQAGQAADAANPVQNPPPVYMVDPIAGGNSPSDNIFSTIQEAISAAQSTDYAVVEVKSGTYAENIYAGGTNVLVIAQRGSNGELSPNPPVISGTTGNALTLYGPSIWDGFIVTHTPPAKGRGIEVDSNDHVRLVNCVIRDNFPGDSYENGGGLLQNSATGQLDLVHCTLTRNSAGTSGNGGYIYGRLALINSILWDSGTAPEEIGTSDFGQPQVNVMTSIVKGGQFGGIDQDPLITREGWLTAGSPAIDRAGVTSVIGHDIHNQPRPNGSSADIGADEWTNSDGSASDSLPNWWKYKYFGSPFASVTNSGNGDTTGSDSFTNLDEYLQGTNPTMGDTDGDGLSDSDDVALGTDPNVADTDGDGMTDGYEHANGLNPLHDDSLEDKDGDRYPNVFEFAAGTSASNPASKPSFSAGPSSTARYFRVDPAAAGASTTDNIYSKIQDAINAATQDCSIIEVKGGVYDESLTISQRRILVMGDMNPSTGPVEVRGGAYGFALSMQTSSVVDGLEFTHKPGVSGGGLFIGLSGDPLESRSRRLVNCIIYGNSSDYGAGIELGGGDLQVLQSTLVANSASSTGNAIEVGYQANLTLDSSVVWNEGGAAGEEIHSEMGDSAVHVNSSIIRGGEFGAWDAPSAPVDRTGLPRPANAFSPSGNPAVDRIALTDLKVAKDIFGASRPSGSGGDLGAVEFVDSDSDGILDSWEMLHFGTLNRDLSNSYSDGDTLSDQDEYFRGTDPFSSDSDFDGVPDGLEVNQYHTDPLNPDSDGDGLSDGLEINQLHSNPLADDSDSDGMPDSWEYQYRSAPQKAGTDLTVPDAGEDPDHDLQSNIQEYRQGTDPTAYNSAVSKADSDKDGLYDDEELDEFFTDPAVSNHYTSQTESTVLGNAGIFTGAWINADDAAYLYAPQGSATYTFALQTSDIYIADIQWQALYLNNGADVFNLKISCDGQLLRYYLADPSGKTDGQNLRVVLPYLPAGQHQLEIEVFGASTNPCLQIDKIGFKKITDDSTGPMSNIMQGRLAALNGITTTAQTSLTSPLCLEGKGRFLSTIHINGSTVPLAALKDHWYANVPLASTGSTQIPVSFENGALEQSLQIQWVATNVFTAGQTLTIRKGDSLKLVACPSGTTSGDMTIQIGGQSFNGNVSTPIIHEFDTAGSFAVTGEYGSKSRTITVNVVDASFPGKALGVVGKARDWKCPGISRDLPFQADGDLLAEARTLSPQGTTFHLTTQSENIRHIVVRAFDGGPVLAVGDVQGFRFYSWQDAGLEQVGITSSGLNIDQMSIRVSIPWEDGISVRITAHAAGVTLDNGSISETWTSADAGDDGAIHVTFYAPSTATCHGYAIFQDGDPLN